MGKPDDPGGPNLYLYQALDSREEWKSRAERAEAERDHWMHEAAQFLDRSECAEAERDTLQGALEGAWEREKAAEAERDRLREAFVEWELAYEATGDEWDSAGSEERDEIEARLNAASRALHDLARAALASLSTEKESSDG